MAYGEIKVDTVTFTDGGIDKSVSISGLVQNPTFSGNITVTGTISGNTIQGQTVSGVTVTGTTAAFTSGTFTTITGGTATITSGVFASGTAAAPSVSVGTTDNGIYSPGTDQVAVATNGTGRLFVDASGNVGVGTSSVNALLEVNNSTAGGEVQRIEGNYDGSGSVILTNWRRAGGSVAAALKYNDDSSPLCMSIGTTTSHEFRIRTADTDAITIDASQRVGIGTSAPGAKIHSLQASAGEGLRVDGADSGFSLVVEGGTTYHTKIRQGSIGSTYFGNTPPANGLIVEGSVGIGTTSPAAPLDVNGAIYSRSTGVYTDAITAYGGSSLAVNAGSSNLNITVNASERARIDSSGRLLIGTSSARSGGPYGTAGLQVESTSFTNASISAINNENTSDGVALMLGKSRGSSIGSTTIVSSGDQIGGVYFQGADGSALRPAASIFAEVDGTPGANDMPGRLIFATTADGAASPTERMRITSAGSVGIGTTSPGSILDVKPSASSSNIRIEAGTINSDSIRLQAGGTVNTYLEYRGYLGHAWFVDATERARIDSSGRLLVGTSTGQGDALLQVQGLVGSPTGWGVLRLTRGLNTAAIGGNVGALLGDIDFGANDNTTAARIRCESDASWSSTSDTPGALTFSTTADGASSPTERLRITSAGLVGIGTSAPAELMQLRGSGATRLLLSSADNTTDRGVYFGTSDNTVLGYIKQEYSTGTFEISSGSGAYSSGIGFRTGGVANRVVIDSSGRVGIGTTSPGTPLHIASQYPSIRLQSNTGSYQQRSTVGQFDNIMYIECDNDNAVASSAIAFTVDNTERMRIDSSGNVGIGTTNAGELLSVNGNVSITSTYRIKTSDSGGNLTIQGGGTYPGGHIILNGGNGSDNIIFNRSGASASTVETARIDSSGRLLVGTSSARSNVYRGASSLISPVQIDSNANSYSNGINVLNYSGSGYGSVFTLGLSLSNTQGTNTVVRNNDELGYLNFVGNDGTNFRTGAWIGGEVDGTPGAGDMPGRLVFSTTADGASTPTERMRISSEGSVLVGTTTGSGSVSNSTPVVAGRFYSFNGSSSAASGSAITMFTAPNTNATYMVTARLASVQDAANYEAVTLLSANAGASVSLVATPLKTGGLLTISLSGADVQATQGAGGPATISWVVTRIG
jgi:hypothetical protein